MTGAEVAGIVAYLEDAGIRIWLDGGWGVDALIGEETRLHGDLDAVVEQEKIASIIATLASVGFRGEVDDRPSRSVLAAGGRRQIDFHRIVFDGDGTIRQIGAAPMRDSPIHPTE